MIGWIILGVWVLGALLTFRPVARGLIHDIAGPYDFDWEVVISGSLMALLVCAFAWPCAVSYFALRRMALNDPERAARILAGESRDAKVRRLERERAEREQRIRDLERELGIEDS